MEYSMQTLADKIIQFRWPIIIGFVAMTVILGLQLRFVEIDPDMKSQLPEDIVSRINTEKIDELFGGTDMLMVLVRTDDVLNAETFWSFMKELRHISCHSGRRVLVLSDMPGIIMSSCMLIGGNSAPIHLPCCFQHPTALNSIRSNGFGN